MTVLPALRWRASPNESARTTGPVRLVVVHRPVGSYAGSIRALCDPQHQASAHVIVRDDGGEATQLVAWHRKAWACEGFNSASDNIETPDRIWTEALDAGTFRVMQTCARVVAFRLHVRGLPAEWVHGGALLHGHGFTRHYDLGAAGGGHTDPTLDGARWGVFVALVTHELSVGGFRLEWGR